MKLTGITWQGYALPFRDSFRTSRGRADTRHGLLVFLKTDTGTGGAGEASPVGAGSLDEVNEIAAALERLAPAWLGKDLAALAGALNQADMPNPLRCGLETALLDIRGRRSGQAIATLLGGRPATLAVNAIIAAGSPERAAAEAGEAVNNGFTSLKLKVGGTTPEDDEALVSAVRRAAGPGVRLRLDPNQAWDADTAIASILRLSRYDLEYVEQPVPADDIAGLAAVRRAVPVPLAADESLGSAADLRRLLEADAADIFIIKAARLGGIRISLDIARAAVAAGKTAVVTTSLESGVGIAAAAHLAAALPQPGPAHGLATGTLFTGDLVSPRLWPAGGKIATPDGPGLGVTVAAELLRKYSSGIIGPAGSSSR